MTQSSDMICQAQMLKVVLPGFNSADNGNRLGATVTLVLTENEHFKIKRTKKKNKHTKNKHGYDWVVL